MCTLTKNILILASERWPSQCTLYAHKIAELPKKLLLLCGHYIVMLLLLPGPGHWATRDTDPGKVRPSAVLIIMTIIYLTCPPWSNTHITHTPPLSTSHLINILHLATLWPVWAEFLNTERAPNTGPPSLASHHRTISPSDEPYGSVDSGHCAHLQQVH